MAAHISICAAIKQAQKYALGLSVGLFSFLSHSCRRRLLSLSLSLSLCVCVCVCRNDLLHHELPIFSAHRRRQEAKRKDKEEEDKRRRTTKTATTTATSSLSLVCPVVACGKLFFSSSELLSCVSSLSLSLSLLFGLVLY